VLRCAAKCNQSKLSKTATFEQLGFDSLDVVEIIVAMEENIGVDIPNEEA
jgi:acyl carrier protein